MGTGIIDRIRQPEYTGNNRCTPCTAVNLGIAVAVSVVIGWSFLPAGVIFFVLALGAIALRGYLVPGTPTLTARYLPDRIHRWFEHGPDRTVPDDEDVSLEGILISWGVLEDCEDEDDLCLRDPIRNRFRNHLAGLDDEVGEEKIATIYDVDPPDVTRTPRYPPMVKYAGERSEWPSEAALKADVAMADTLADVVPEWSDASLARRGSVLAGLRPFVETCPDCDGSLTLGEEVVRSCCRERDVVRLKCTECDATIFEVEADTITD